MADQGASAVEFALVLPILLVLVFGIVDFGRAFNAWIELSGAAREGARYMVVHNDAAAAKTIAVDHASSLGLTTADVTVTPATCTSGGSVTATVVYHFSMVTPLIPAFLSGDSTFNISRSAVMQCGG